jgi:hypothetical protein
VAHVRQQIRERIVSVLNSNVTLVSNRVYGTRVYSLTDADLPAITVYAGSEASALANHWRQDICACCFH